MKATVKVLISVVAVLSSLIVVGFLSVGVWIRWQHRLPSDQIVRKQFLEQKANYVRLATLLRTDPSEGIDPNGDTHPIGNGTPRHVPEYFSLIQRIGAKFVYLRDDGSIEFELWGYGCAPCADSYKGVRFEPRGTQPRYPYGGAPKIVRSLDDENLRQTGGKIADGLYIVPLDDEWSIYRLEISD